MIYSKLQFWDTEGCNSNTLKFNPSNGLRGIRILKNRAGFLIQWLVCKICKTKTLINWLYSSKTAISYKKKKQLLYVLIELP